MEWRGGSLDVTKNDFADVFRQELKKANYPVVGDTNVLFDDPSASKAELLVAGLINKVESNVCFPQSESSDWSTVKGGAFIQVDWQVYSQIERKIIYETTTQGSYETEEAKSGGSAKLLTKAFAVATHNLLADNKFHDLVIKSKSQRNESSPASQYPYLKIEQPQKVSSNIADVRAAAVTIFVGQGHASGFIISKSGYVLTNRHVVGEARFVKLRLENGREILADVIRTDRARDVALLKTAEGNLPCMHLRLLTEPKVGDEVFAVGSPLSEELELSVTKGVVSGYREEAGLKYIQSDVQTHPGSSGGPLVDKKGEVVGICSGGISINGASQNLNFFIPIADAMSHLGIGYN